MAAEGIRFKHEEVKGKFSVGPIQTKKKDKVQSRVQVQHNNNLNGLPIEQHTSDSG